MRLDARTMLMKDTKRDEHDQGLDFYEDHHGVHLGAGHDWEYGYYTFNDDNELRELANAINTYLYDKDHDGSND